MSQFVYHDEARRLRTLASNENVLVFFSPHAEGQMAKRKISKIDIMSILKRSSVVNSEFVDYEERWTAQGPDADGRVIHVVGVARERELSIDVVTAIAK